MPYEIILAPEAVEDLRELAARERAIVREALERRLRHEPTRVSESNVKRLRGLKQPQYRLRVDELRVFYDVRDQTVEVLAIVPKSLADRWLARWGEAAEPGEQP